jgi:hypothetical protein
VQRIISTVENPIKKTGHLQVLWGNLAPEGSVAKITGKEGLYFSGPARVFEGEEAMLSALSEDPQSLKGTVIVIRGEGPKGGPGMPEMLTPTSAVIGAGLGKVTPSNFTLWYQIYLMSIQHWFSYKYVCDVKSLSYSYYSTWAAGSCTVNRWSLLWWISWIRCWPHLS